MSERLDVKNMVVGAEKAPERYFDAKRDVTSEQKEALKKYFETLATHDLLLIAGALVLADASVVIKESGKRKIENERAKHVAREEWDQVLLPGVLGRMLGLSFSLSEKDVNSIKKVTAPMKPDNNAFATQVDMMEACELLGAPLGIDAEVKQRIQKITESFAEEGNWYAYSYWARHCRVLGVPIIVGEREQQGMREEREGFARKESWPEFAVVVINETIISASKVAIPPEGGLRLYGGEILDEKQSPLPSTRQF